ncbi:microsomal glutathione S-transferase 1-like [Esox lucius]|uniref:microsomal glutathione S-transferase 1-like n=1 Tax=Esox lucius TaxID=8010 RepID=UPI00147697CF|nr:microsomal glutathione S-transferase 1-like [Esox lucius]
MWTDAEDDTSSVADSKAFLAFSTYATIVILKMMLLAPVAWYFCFTHKVKMCHQNDLENIVPFVVIGLLYALTGPDLSTALLHFRVFVGSRLCHTVAYLLPLPQPSRALAWLVGMIVTFSMAYQVFRTAHL